MNRRVPQSLIHRRRTAGSVILLVLVTVLLAAFLLTKFVQRAGTEMLADARAGDQARLRREAYSALEATLAVLADVRTIDSGLHSPAQGWDEPLDYAGYTPEGGRKVEIAFEDESGKISLPKADPATLEALFELFGLNQADAEKATDALLVWTRENYVPTSLDTGADNYQRAAIPHNAAQRPLRSFAELAAIEYVRDVFCDDDGRPNDLAREFAANVSLYSFERINLNSAPAMVLAVGGLASGQIDGLKDRHRREEATAGLGYFKTVNDTKSILGADAPLQKFGADVLALRINVTVRDGAAVYRLSAVVAPPGGASLATAAKPAAPAAASTGVTATETAPQVIKKLDYPFKVLEIREDVEAPVSAPAESTDHDR